MKRFIIKTVLFSLGIVVVLELTTRIFIPQQLVTYNNFYTSAADGLGRKPAPNVDMVVNTGERPIRLVTDERGYRVSPTPTPTPTDTPYRVLFIGDSYVQAIQVEYTQTMTALYQERLETQLDRPVVVDNMGSASFNINHYAIALDNVLSNTDQQYDEVFIFVNPSNDLIGERITSYPPSTVFREQTDFRMPDTLTYSAIVKSWIKPANEILERQSQLFILLKNQGEQFLAQIGLTARYFPWALERANIDRPEWNISANRLLDAQRTADEHDVELSIVVVPMITQADKSWTEFYTSTFNIDPNTLDIYQPITELKNRLEPHNVQVLAPLDEFISAIDDGTQLYGTADTHFSPAGHVEMADFLIQQKTS